MCECMHVQNHVYTNKSRRTYIHDICQLLKSDVKKKSFKIANINVCEFN